MSIKIVQKKLQNNKVSLALKIYQEGKSKQYKLKDLFLYSKPTNLNEKNHNTETKKLAESILVKRQLEIQSTSYNVHTGFKSQGSFLDYFNKLVRERRESEGNYGNWKSAYKHLLNCANGNDVKFSDCDDDFLKGFKRFLLEGKLTKSNTRLSNNSALSYYKVKAALTQAYNDRIITDNPGSRIKGIQQEENPREYLLHEELKKLVKTPCDMPMLKTAFLFSCITGLRWSDINKLDWKEVIYSEAENQWKIHFKQKKTKGIQYHPISDEAYEILVNNENKVGRVFKGLRYIA